VLDLIDGAVYTSEIEWTKPHPEAFLAVMHAVGAQNPTRCVFVGDRLFDDIWGAGQVSMRTIWIPHSDIPVDQHGHSEGRPDATVQGLADVRDVVSQWHTG
jgi:putative hydrolase of the HAD superfamily